MRTTNTQTAPPQMKRSQYRDDEHFHYVSVENRDTKNWETPLPDMLDQASYVDPEKPLYEVVSDKREVTGSNNKTLLRMSKADYDAMLHAASSASREAVSEVSTSEDGNNFETISGPAISL